MRAVSDQVARFAGVIAGNEGPRTKVAGNRSRLVGWEADGREPKQAAVVGCRAGNFECCLMPDQQPAGANR